MARVNVPVTKLVSGAITAQPAGTTADATEDHVLTVDFPLEELLLHVTQTNATARVLTIKAGDSPPALSAGLGDITQSIAQNAVYVVGGLESARFLRNDGTLHIDLAESFAGTIRAYRVPR